MHYRIIYSSKAAQPMSADTLEKILHDARTGNEQRGITGALVYADGVFFQVLEGDEDVLRDLMKNIASDTRHHSLKVFHESAIVSRSFDSWRMAYLTPSAKEMSTWAGLEGTETIDRLLEHVYHDVGRVPRILVSIVEALAGSADTAGTLH